MLQSQSIASFAAALPAKTVLIDAVRLSLARLLSKLG